MNIEQFAEEMRKRLEDVLPSHIKEEGALRVTKQEKNNGLILHGITMTREDMKMSPVVYVDEYFEAYQKATDLNAVASDICRIFEEVWDKASDMDLSLDYETVKDRLTARVVDMKRNRSRLMDLAYSNMGNGIAMTYHIEVGENASIVISRELAQSKGYELNRLCSDALESVQKNHPVKFISMDEMMSALMDGREIDEALDGERKYDPENAMFVLTNKDNTFGAAAMYYPDVREKIADAINDNYYAVPSSVHEWIIVPQKVGTAVEALNAMLKEGNENAVTRDQILGDRVFSYDRERKAFEIAKSERTNEERNAR